MLRGFFDFLRAFRPRPIRCVGHRAKFQAVASVLFDAKQRIDLCFQQGGQNPRPLRYFGTVLQKIDSYGFFSPDGNAVGGYGQPLSCFNAPTERHHQRCVQVAYLYQLDFVRSRPLQGFVEHLCVAAVYEDVEFEIPVVGNQCAADFRIAQVRTGKNLPAPVLIHGGGQVVGIFDNQVFVTYFVLPYGKPVANGFAECQKLREYAVFRQHSVGKGMPQAVLVGLEVFPRLGRGQVKI